MPTRRFLLLTVLVTTGFVFGAAAPGGPQAAVKVRVVTSIPDLKALTDPIGGDLVEVDSLARGDQNPHDLEVRPSQMVRLRRADLFIMNGLELDGWAEVAIQGANNPALVPGGVGRVDASRGIPVLEVPTGRVDRSMGDVHPSGNPHYTLDPALAPQITANIVDGLSRVAPEARATFEQRRQEFLRRIDAALTGWTQTLAPFKGTRVVTNHNLWRYFLARFGLGLTGTVEERPGIPPSPEHLARLMRQMRADGVRVLILEPWGDRKLAERLAVEGQAKVVPLAPGVGSRKGTDTYLAWIDYNVKALAQALQ